MHATSSLRNIKKLTVGEMMFLKRRRKGISQSEMAAKMKMSYHAYRSCETDGGIAALADYKKLLPLTEGEVCVLYRRRAGMKVEEVAKAIVRCRYWVRQMEQDKQPCEELLRYWEIESK